jgi:hypothetical protein
MSSTDGGLFAVNLLVGLRVESTAVLMWGKWDGEDTDTTGLSRFWRFLGTLPTPSTTTSLSRDRSMSGNDLSKSGFGGELDGNNCAAAAAAQGIPKSMLAATDASSTRYIWLDGDPSSVFFSLPCAVEGFWARMTALL